MDTAPVPNVAFSGSACFQCYRSSTGTNNGLKRCSGCKVVRYCSTECSRRDWKDHKSFCRSVEAIRNSVPPPRPFVPGNFSDEDDDDDDDDTERISERLLDEIRLRRVQQRKLWLVADEVLEPALKRSPTTLEAKMLWRENRCAVCWDREVDVEARRAGGRATMAARDERAKIVEISEGDKGGSNDEGGKRDREQRDGWRLCRRCRVVGWCCDEHERMSSTMHREIKDSEGRTQCESVQLSNEIDEFFLRRHLAAATPSTSSSSSSLQNGPPAPPSLWVPTRILPASTSPFPLPASWTEYLDSVKDELPTKPTRPTTAEVYGVFVEGLSPVLTILEALDRFGIATLLDQSRPSRASSGSSRAGDGNGDDTEQGARNTGQTTLTVYLVDESLATCSSWIPTFEELQHQLPVIEHLDLVTVSPVPPPRPTDPTPRPGGSAPTKVKTPPLPPTPNTALEITTLPTCPQCVSAGRTRTIRHVESLPSLASNGTVNPCLAVSFNSSLPLVDLRDRGSISSKWWTSTLETLFPPLPAPPSLSASPSSTPRTDPARGPRSMPQIPFVATFQTRTEAIDAVSVLERFSTRTHKYALDELSTDPIERVWDVERNPWRGGWPRVEGWFGLDEMVEPSLVKEAGRGDSGQKTGEGRDEVGELDGGEGEGLVWKNGWWIGLRGR
ncbi:hypothetical protein JCM10212_003621 [Sporobolomyces blumeae]